MDTNVGMAVNRQCTDCLIDKPLSEFFIRRSICKKCHRFRVKKAYDLKKFGEIHVKSVNKTCKLCGKVDNKDTFYGLRCSSCVSEINREKYITKKYNQNTV